MNEIVQICPNITLVHDEGFGDFCVPIVSDVIMNIDMAFSRALSIHFFSSKPCIIKYNHFKDEPRCSDTADGRVIYLHTHDDYWCQWAYQFAHEYCHHLINGPMIDEISGLMWFEETICELSSMYHIHNIYKAWSSYPTFSTQNIKAPIFRDYLDGLLSRAMEKGLRVGHIPLQTILQSWDSLLRENVYHRDHYNAIAARMFPLFLENPYLWKMILHIGDSRQWNSLEELFVHLERNADDSYSDSLIQLKNLLIP